jgi:single-strand DNA-binding protein
MNQVTIVGNLTADPELRYTKSQKAVANFTVAVSHREYHNGRSQDVLDGFFPVVAWNGLADNAVETVHKGSRVLVAGKLVQRSFEIEDQKRTVTEIVASHVGPELSFASATVTKNSAVSSPAPAERVG